MKRVEIDLPDETFAGLDRESAELAGLGTRLATSRGGPEAQVPEKKGLKEVAERVETDLA